MSAVKAMLKAGAANEIGALVEDALEAARAEAFRAEGATAALGHAEKLIAQLVEVLEKEHAEEGGCELARRFLDRATNAVRGLAGKTENARLMAVGKVSAHEASVKMIAKYRDAEKAKGKSRGKDS